MQTLVLSLGCTGFSKKNSSSNSQKENGDASGFGPGRGPVPATCGASLNIVGGRPVSELELVSAATVKIWFKDERYCTGTFVGPQQVVTAAHCFKDVAGPDEISLAFGIDAQVQENIKVKSFVVHQRFEGILTDSQGFKQEALHDVAVLTFDGYPNKNMLPVGIASSNALYASMPVIVAGYGLYSSTDKEQRPLTQVNLNIENLRVDFKEIQLKAGAGKGACFGDSGGPTFIFGDKGRCILLVGSTTGPARGTNYSCESGGATVMDLTRYRDWISCTLAQMGSPLLGVDAAAACRAAEQ